MFGQKTELRFLPESERTSSTNVELIISEETKSGSLAVLVKGYLPLDFEIEIGKAAILLRKKATGELNEN